MSSAGNGGEAASGLCVLSSAGDGGESASGGAKGEWGQVSFGVVCETVAVVVCFLFLGGRGASQLPGVRRGTGASQLWGWV